MSKISLVTINGEPVKGPMGCLIALGVLILVGLIFGVIAIVFTFPIWLPILIAIMLKR